MENFTPPGWELTTFAGVVVLFTVIHEIMKRVMAKLLAKF